MNTLTKGFARRVLSMLLVIIMVFSLGIVGLTTASAANVELAETGVTYKVGDYIYFKNCYVDELKCNWILSNGEAWIHLYNQADTIQNDAKFELCSGTAGETGAIYRAKVTKEADYYYAIITRNNTGSTTPWDKNWNQTQGMKLSDLGGNNCYTKIYNNGTAFESESYSYTPQENVYVLGTFNDWNYDSGLAEHIGNGHHYTKTITLEANKTYSFKVLSYGTWYGNTGTMVSDNCTEWLFESDKDNCKITTTIAGEYIFDFWGDTHLVTVTYPDEPFKATVIAMAKDTVVEQGEPIIVNTSVIGEPTTIGFFVSDLRLYRVTGTGVDGPYGLINDQLQYPTTDLALGTYEFYVEADVVADGETKKWTSDRFSATVVEAEADTITISAANVNVYAGQTTTIKVTSKLSSNIASNQVTYEFYLGDEKVETNTKGTYDVVTTDADAGKTRTYRIVASTTDSKGAPINAETTVTVTIHSTSGGDGIVTIYFKSAESYGYVPSIKFGADGTYAEMTKAGAVIGHNTTNTGHYWWYSATTTAVDGKVEFSLTSPRFFKDCTYTLDVTKEAPEKDGSYEYYFAIDNLNLVTSDIINVTGKSYKNYFNTIIDMVTELTPDELVQTGTTFEYYALGDANNDGKLNIRDATIIQKELAEIAELSYAGNVVADVNGDGKLTIKDATAIQKQLAGL